MGYAEPDLGDLPDGFGFLIPASENRSMLACTFVHRKFPGRAPKGIGLLRCFLGGARNAALLNETDEQIESRVRAELKEILGITGKPRFVRILRWRRAMAQYAVGTCGAHGAHFGGGEPAARACAGGQCLSRHRGAGLHSLGSAAAASVLGRSASQRYGRFRFQSQT